MDIDHEAQKHDVPRSSVEGEAERTAAEDPGQDIKEVLESAKETVEPEVDSDQTGTSQRQAGQEDHTGDD